MERKQDKWQRSRASVANALREIAGCLTQTQSHFGVAQDVQDLISRLEELPSRGEQQTQEFMRDAARRLAKLAQQVGNQQTSPLSKAIAGALAVLHPLRASEVDPDSDEAWRQVQAAPPIRNSRPARAGSGKLQHHERRSAQRVELDVDIGLISDSNFYTGFVEDISSGGLFVGTYRGVTLGTEVELSFVLPNGQHIVTQGVVRWLREARPEINQNPGLGVAFTSLSEDDRRAIEDFMAHRAPIFFDD